MCWALCIRRILLPILKYYGYFVFYVAYKRPVSQKAFKFTVSRQDDRIKKTRISLVQVLLKVLKESTRVTEISEYYPEKLIDALEY